MALYHARLVLVFGIMAVIPIGGADMPVVISLLNSIQVSQPVQPGLRQCNILIVAGS